MSNRKSVTLGFLDVEPEQGKIWLNSPNCTLRIQGLDFKNIREKFSMIDINNGVAYMIEENSNDKAEIETFMEKSLVLLYTEMSNNQEMNQTEFLENGYKALLDYVNNYRRIVDGKNT